MERNMANIQCRNCNKYIDDSMYSLKNDGTLHKVCNDCRYKCKFCKEVLDIKSLSTDDQMGHICVSCRDNRCRTCGIEIEALLFTKKDDGTWYSLCNNCRNKDKINYIKKREKMKQCINIDDDQNQCKFLVPIGLGEYCMKHLKNDDSKIDNKNTDLKCSAKYCKNIKKNNNYKMCEECREKRRARTKKSREKTDVLNKKLEEQKSGDRVCIKCHIYFKKFITMHNKFSLLCSKCSNIRKQWSVKHKQRKREMINQHILKRCNGKNDDGTNCLVMIKDDIEYCPKHLSEEDKKNNVVRCLYKLCYNIVDDTSYKLCNECREKIRFNYAKRKFKNDEGNSIDKRNKHLKNRSE